MAVTIRRDIIRPLVEFNFGPEANIPLFAFDSRETEDQNEAVEVLKTLACDMGLEIPASYIYKKFNIPEPEGGEEVLHPQLYTRVGAERREQPEEAEETSFVPDVEEGEFQIVRTKKFPIKPMTVDEASLQMDLLGHSFYAFKNEDSEAFAVVYRRNDGGYGLIEDEG